MSEPTSQNSWAIETFDLSHTYGELTALNRLNLQVGRGDIFGFIGSNGAGKTTALKILSLFLRPASGTASIYGYDIHHQGDEIRRLIGYMPDTFGVYKDMLVVEYLDFFGACYQMKRSDRAKKIEEILQLVGLSEKRNDLASHLSRGMQQRLGLARVLIHDPDLLLLDEPASGLDPRARVEMMNILRELQKKGKTILISSHILSELQSLCNRVGIIEKGNLLYCGSTHDLKFRQSVLKTFRIRTLGDSGSALQALKGGSSIEDAQLVSCGLNGHGENSHALSEIRVTLKNGCMDPGQISELLLPSGVKLVHLVQEEISLEQTFLNLTRGEVQ